MEVWVGRWVQWRKIGGWDGGMGGEVGGMEVWVER